MYQKDSIYFGMQHSVKLDPNMRKNQNWVTFDDNHNDNDKDKGEFQNRSEYEWGNDFHTDRKINDDGFENRNEFLASPLVSNNICGSLKERHLCSDKNVTEFRLPKLEICDRDNHVKDICVDNGVASKENILLDGEICNGPGLESDLQIELGTFQCESTNGMGVEYISLEESRPLSNNDCDCVMGDDMGLLGKSNRLKSIKALFESRSSDASDVEHLSDQVVHPKTTESPAVGPLDDDSTKGTSELSYNSKTESGTITFDFNSVKHESESIDESLNNKDINLDQSVKVNSHLIHDSTMSSYLTNENKVQCGQGESSFSMVGHVSGLISCSGSIPYSGSISVRSDSSTTSARSFAFPILPNEWNSSPVRMAKADRRRLRRDKGWINGLFCCRF